MTFNEETLSEAIYLSIMSFAVKPHLSVLSREVLKCAMNQTRRISSGSAASTSVNKWSQVKMMLKATGFGAVVGGAYAWYTLTLPNQVSASDMIVQQTATIVPALPNVTFARQVNRGCICSSLTSSIGSGQRT